MKAYLYNEKLYANTDGVKTSTKIATMYFISLFSTFIFFIITLIYISMYKKNKVRKVI